MHTKAYAAGYQVGRTLKPGISLAHSFSHACKNRDTATGGRECKTFAYWSGMADALRARLPVTGPVGSHGSFAKSAPTQSTIVDFRRSVTRQYAPDMTAAANITAHNKAIVRGPVKERPEIVYSTDVVPLADKRSCYVVTTVTTKGTSRKTNEARRAAALREAQDMAELRRLDMAGRLTTHQFERMGSRMGAASPSNK